MSLLHTWRRLAAVMLDRRLTLVLPSTLILLLPACNNVSVHADNKYGQTRAVGVVGVPIETVTDQVRPVRTRRSADIEVRCPLECFPPLMGTITVLIDGLTEKVRLIGIDAPEIDQAPWGVPTRDALRLLVDGKGRTAGDRYCRARSGQAAACICLHR